MLNTPTLDKLRTLKLHGMARAFEEQLKSSEIESLSFNERLGLLVDQETTERENRSLQTRLKQTKFRLKACMADIDYSQARGIDKSLMKSLATCKWIKDHLNVLICGPSGVGKSYIGCALGHQACLLGFKALYFRAPRLFPDLATSHGDGRYNRLLSSMTRADLLIIDDWGLSSLKAQERNDLLELLEDRHGLRSTILISQYPVENWHGIIGNPTLADAILDRIVHNAYKFNLKGDSLRKKKSSLSGE